MCVCVCARADWCPVQIQWKYLQKSDTTTGCPYKGHASYYDAVVDGKTIKDVVWYYESPTQESIGIKGLYCFYPDKVRTWVDGKEIERIGMPAKPNLEGPKAKGEAPAPGGVQARENGNGNGTASGYQGKSCNC